MADNKYLKIENIGNSYMGTAFCTPKYGKYAGQMLELFQIDSMSVSADIEVIRRRTLNNAVMQEKPRVIGYRFTINAFQCSSKFQEIMQDFQDNGAYPYLDFTLTNNWAQDGLGVQQVKLEGALITSCDLFKLNVNSEDETQTLSGSAQKFKVLTAATEPSVSWNTP